MRRLFIFRIILLTMMIFVSFALAQYGGPAPQITSITPSAAPNNATVDLVINGDNFVSGLSVTLVKSPNSIAGTDVFVSNAQRAVVTFDIRNQPTGAWRVTITNPDQQQASFDSFNIETPAPANTGGSESDNTTIGPAPSIAAVTPNATANDNNNFRILIRGANFDSDHGADTTSFLSRGEDIVLPVEQDIIDSRTIVATFDMTKDINNLPATAGAWDVEVYNPDNQSAKLRDGVRVVEGPKPGAPSLLQRLIPASFRPYVHQPSLLYGPDQQPEEQPTEQMNTTIDDRFPADESLVDYASVEDQNINDNEPMFTHEPIMEVELFNWLQTIIAIIKEKLLLFVDKLAGLFVR